MLLLFCRSNLSPDCFRPFLTAFPAWDAIRKWILNRTCQTKVTTDQTTPDQIVHWSHWSSIETQIALGVSSKLSVIRPCQTQMTSYQTETRTLSRLSCDHDREQTQTIVQTIVRPIFPLIKLNCAQNSPINYMVFTTNESLLFSIICSFHTNWRLH